MEEQSDESIMDSLPSQYDFGNMRISLGGTSIPRTSRLRIGSKLKTWAEVSVINYLEDRMDPYKPNRQSNIRARSFALSCCELGTLLETLPNLLGSTGDNMVTEEFPKIVTTLMNEENLWGCFYNFPELYDDAYSPTVRVLRLRDVDDLVGGVLTRDMVAACISYLHRSPIMGDYVYINLNLTGKYLMNIDILAHYKYLVYLDLASNLLTNLSVLSNLPYLQYLSVDFNRLENVLDYSTPQWFLTDVHYRYNSVTKISDLTMFWSITVLDLSHNNIKSISGLQNLRYLRHLDLSFNHIQRVENLSHLRLLWLDLSYNNISSFEISPTEGLWTLLHLEYLNLDENSLQSMKIFSGCTRLRELYLRNNRLSAILEMAVYMRQIRRLTVLDLRANPVCSVPCYEDVVFDTFPMLVYLDDQELDPIHQRNSKMETLPDITTFACRRLLRMLYVEQLSRAPVPITPPADTEEVPLVVFVGQEAVGKGTLARRLAAEYASKIVFAHQHTTALYHNQAHYIEVSQQKFDEMLLAGEFLTYYETTGQSYGLSRKEAFISDGKVRICTMDSLISALMLQLRGRRPYLILCSCADNKELIKRQLIRREERNTHYEHRMSFNHVRQQSTLQVLLSGRIVITGILNEIILGLEDEKCKSEFALDSQCSLLEDSELHESKRRSIRPAELLSLLSASTSTLSDRDSRNNSHYEMSLYSIYKRSQDSSSGNTGSRADSNAPEYQKNDAKKTGDAQKTYQSSPSQKDGHGSTVSGQKICGNQNFRASSAWKGYDSSRTSKSVTFTGPTDVAGMKIDPPPATEEQKQDIKSHGISISMRWPLGAMQGSRAYDTYPDNSDLWLAFLTETGVIQASAIDDIPRTPRKDPKLEDPESMMKHLSSYHKIPSETVTSNIRDDYEAIHRVNPGLFHDTITMDKPNEAFEKAKRIIRDIVNSQTKIGPMFDIDFAHNLDVYPNVRQRLEDIRKEIAPNQIFH